MINCKTKLFVLIAATFVFSSHPLFLTENTSNIIDLKKDFKTFFFEKIDSVSLEIDYYDDEDITPKGKKNITNKYSTHINVVIPQDDIEFWNKIFYEGIKKISKKDTSKISHTIGKIITFVLKIQIYHDNKCVEIYFPSWGVKNGCGRIEVDGVLHFIFFKKDFTLKFKERLIGLLNYTVNKDFINSEFK